MIEDYLGSGKVYPLDNYFPLLKDKIPKPLCGITFSIRFRLLPNHFLSYLKQTIITGCAEDNFD
jgi:hypothetical protein